MRIYITGLVAVDGCLKNFEKSEEYVRARCIDHFPTLSDTEIINLQKVLQSLPAIEYRDRINIGLERVKTCDMVYLTKDWERGIGSVIEMWYAMANDIAVIHEENPEELEDYLRWVGGLNENI